MALITYSFARITSNIVAAAQASASALLDFTIGSPLLAVAEAISGVCLWLQAIILQLLTLTRAATCEDGDLDSFYADFNFPRLPANAATGSVTFSRFTPTYQAIVPVNQGMQTSDGTQQFFVTIDATNPAYSATLNGYVIAPGTASVTVPVEAVNSGTQANVQANTISQITSGIQYVDTVTNPAAFINGVDKESDPAYRARFVLYIASLSKATKTAIIYAARSVQQGVNISITENADLNGTPDLGFNTVIVDDGSGYPSATLLTNVANAIDAVRPLGSRIGVYPPVVLLADVGMSLITAANYTHTSVVTAVIAALQNFINALPLGTPLFYTQLAAIAYSVPGVTNVAGITLNGSTSDLTATAQNKILAGNISVS